MIGLLISILTFLAVFLGIFAINLVFTDLFKQDRQEELDQLEIELRKKYRQKAKRESETDYSQLDEFMRESHEIPHFSLVDLLKKVNEVIGQSGLHTSIQQVLTWSFVFALVAAISAYFLTFNWISIGVAAGLAASLPTLFVSYKRSQRLAKLTTQLPDALDLMSRIMRAGQTINQGLLVVSEEFKAPVSAEFGYCYEQQNLGIPPEVALRQLAKRTGLIEIQIFVMGVLIHRHTGGNLATLLDRLANIIRQRIQMKETVKSLTAEGRLQAAILLGLPVVMWLLIYLLNPGYAVKLFDHPTLISVTVFMMAVGAFWIRKIVVFDF